MAWNKGELPLHTGVLPPFLYGKGIHDPWVISEALSLEFRFAFDASWTISSFSLVDSEHRQPHVPDGEGRSWEYVSNSHLGALYGSSFFTGINYTSLAKLVNCGGKYIFVNVTEKAVIPFSYKRLSSWKGKTLHSLRPKKLMACVDVVGSLNSRLGCSLNEKLKSLPPLDFPFSLEFLLSEVADENRTIVLAVAGYSYKDLLMSWVCRLRRLRVTNFAVCALDREIYEFSIIQVNHAIMQLGNS